jgi:glycosyltransferase involved in cell wall biosynthesis
MEVTMKNNLPLTVAWISDFPVEWLSDLPAGLNFPFKQHPRTWQMVLLAEFEKNPALRLHIIVLRKHIDKDYEFQRNGVTFHVLKVPGGWRGPSFFWIDTILIGRLLRKLKPALVHAWGTEMGAGLVASRLPYPYLITIQGLLTWYRQLVPMVRYERFATMLEHVSLKRAKTVTTESCFAVEYLRKKYPLLKVQQAEHAPNRLFHAVQRRPQTQPIRFIFIATLDYRKGTDLLFRALDELSRSLDFELVVVSGQNRRYFEELKPSISVDFWNRVTFKTNLLPAQVAEELSVATMLLFPTRADTSPNAVKECVVAGVPVVASRIGGITDYVLPGKNGFLFDSNDFSGFLAAIRRACEHPMFSRGKVDSETLEKMRKYLAPETMAENFLTAYKSALK